MARKKMGSVYCSGPLFSPEEVGVMKRMAKILKAARYETYLPQRDGVEAFIMNSVNNPLANLLIPRSVTTLISKAVYAVDIYQLLAVCDHFVLNMNGRVPDEGAVVEAAIAYALGKPIVIYKNDTRSLSAGRDHPMLESCGSVVKDLEALPAALAGIATDTTPAAVAPAALLRASAFGGRVWKLLRVARPFRPPNYLMR